MVEELILDSLVETKKLGQKIGNQLSSIKKSQAFIIFLDGDLGSGKTTLVKEIILALGVNESVTSPTFTIIEPYSLEGRNIYHMDLYRIESASELAAIGIDEYCKEENSIIFIEWPEKSFGYFNEFDMKISLKHESETKRKYWIELKT
jgi:tRNA threonylcarbamoyladenosine biosynthesis protein TsaE